jgi:ribosome biogenesis SPOUT family RNA methylase Rps3
MSAVTGEIPATHAAADGKRQKSFAFIIEHLDPELGPWSALEYRSVAKECNHTHNSFILSSVDDDLLCVEGLRSVVAEGGRVERRGVEELFPMGMNITEDEVEGTRVRKERVCLLDPLAERELSPDDGEVFEGFLFGGILGMTISSSITHLQAMQLRPIEKTG